jgi:hypothetical protein
MLTGDSVLLLDGSPKALQIATNGWEDHTALLRRRIKLPDLKMARDLVGRITKNEISPSLIGSFFILSFFENCIMMSMLIPICNLPENGFLAKCIAVSLGALFWDLQLFRQKNNNENSNLLLEEVDRANSVISEYILLAEDKKADRELPKKILIF